MSLQTIAQIKQSHLTIESTLSALPHYAYQVEADTLVKTVEAVLRRQKTLPGVILTSGGVAIGVISRRKFFEQLGQLYGVAVYMQRPILLMLQAIGATPLLQPARTPIPEAAHQALNRDRNFVYEPIIVDYGDRNYRLLDIYTLLIAQSHLFAGLQRELVQTNDELETRIARRTADLVRLNADLSQEVERRRQVEQELIEARDTALAASRFKSELLAKVSHDLRTPLGGILGNAEMLELGVYGQLSARQQKSLGQIINNTHYLADMVSQLLDQASIEAGRIVLNNKPFRPAELLAEIVDKLGVLAAEKKLELTSFIEPDLPPTLSSDPVRIQQILVNLVSNAIKFTPSGSVTVRLARTGPQGWAIAVKDTGIGIPPEAHSLIFEPFGQVDGSMTRRQKGTGLGLSIVKQLVQLMGGSINLVSAPGQGSEFVISLPLEAATEQQVEPEQNRPAAGGADRGGRRIYRNGRV
ncbi:MAG: hypothetical protein Kow0031_20510 [Anaerolineae bacterium]